MTNLKNKNNLNEFTKAYTDKDDMIYLVNKYNLSDEVQNTTDAFNEMTEQQINDAIQDTFIINNNGIFKYKSYETLDYVKEYLLNCETHQMDMVTSLGDVEVVDVLGTVEDSGHVYIGLEVEYNEYCYLLHIDFNNSWDFVYKDEMIEIQDKINTLVYEQLLIEIGK